MIDLLLEVNRSRGTTLVLVTHDPDLAAVADQTIALKDGRVVQPWRADLLPPSLDVGLKASPNP